MQYRRTTVPEQPTSSRATSCRRTSPLGGGSDAASTTMAGVPTICSCGVRGQWNHTMKEYAVVDSIFDRSKMYVAAVANSDQFAQE